MLNGMCRCAPMAPLRTMGMATQSVPTAMMGKESRQVRPTAMIEDAVCHVPKLIMSVAQLTSVSPELGDPVAVHWNLLGHPCPYRPCLILIGHRIHVFICPNMFRCNGTGLLR